MTEAQSVADTFDDMVTRLENGTFGGRIFGGTDDLRAEDCAFVTYTVRMQNKGFFPAEWISMELVEPKDGDVLALPDDSRHALAAGSVGDMQLTVLRRTDEEEQADTARDASRDLLMCSDGSRLCSVRRLIKKKPDEILVISAP